MNDLGWMMVTHTNQCGIWGNFVLQFIQNKNDRYVFSWTKQLLSCMDQRAANNYIRQIYGKQQFCLDFTMKSNGTQVKRKRKDHFASNFSSSFFSLIMKFGNISLSPIKNDVTLFTIRIHSNCLRIKCVKFIMTDKQSSSTKLMLTNL